MCGRILALFLFVILSCSESITPSAKLNSPTKLPASNVLLEKFAFGSCNKQDKDQPLWADIKLQNPDLWIWLGDIVYADSENPASIAADYKKQLQNPQYADFISEIPVLGIWDDHDYGANNAGREYPIKAQSRDLLFDFLNIPPNDPAWKREGAYQAYSIGPKGQRVKVILLDTRYFRDPKPVKNASEEILRSADILGESQWAWLEKELNPEEAELFIIGGGIQFLPDGHPYEKWSNFPFAKSRLLELIGKSGIDRLVLISGDRHLGEFSKVEIDGMTFPVYEITSSGMTHYFNGAPKEENNYRLGKQIADYNYGMIEIKWGPSGPKVIGSLRGPGGKRYASYEWF